MVTRVHFIDFRQASTQAELAKYCGIPDKLFEDVISEDPRSSLYIRHHIPKRRPRPNDNVRTVWEVPEGPLRDAHKALARRLDLFARELVSAYPHPAAFGYIRGRSTFQNARIHCGAKLLVHADLKNFFPSIGIGRVSRTLCKIGFDATCADLLARFCTIDDQLPLGFHVSPLLANLVCIELDNRLKTLGEQLSCTYTRYADDITFSSNDSLPSRQQLSDVIEACGFKLSEHKFRITKLGQSHFVTGLSVSDRNAPHIPKKMKRQLRLELHYCRKFGLRQHLGRSGELSLQAGINRLDGLVRYVTGVEHKHRQVLRDQWHSVLATANAAPSYMPREDRPLRKVAIIVDEAVFERGDKKRYLALGCVTTEELELVRTEVVAALRQYRSDPYAPGRPRRLEKNGLHFSDVHASVKDDFIKRLAFMPFRGHVGFIPLESDSVYQEAYLTLLQALLPRRFMAADRADLSLYIEQNSKIDGSRISAKVSDVYLELESADNRRPCKDPSVQLVTKMTNPEVAVPDFLLGVLGHYLDLHSGRLNIDRLWFERLRDKYRVVLDIENNLEFSRRRPVLPWPLTT